MTELNNRLAVVGPGDDVDTAHGAFMDTAAIMMNLDLVITSDTSIAHLAGARAFPYGCVTVRTRLAAGSWTETTAPGIPQCGCSGRRLGDWASVFVEIEAAYANSCLKSLVALNDYR